MKKITLLAFLVLVLSGCAAYRFGYGKPPHNKGYLASRDGYTILEYTVGQDNSVPENLKFAKERFKRRRHTVERYYKKMGYIENRFKEWFWDPPVYFVKLITGVFRVPALAISDYRYRHNPKYRDRVKRKEEEQDLKEETINKKLREALGVYIQKDLAKEGPVTAKTEEPKPVEPKPEEPKPEAVQQAKPVQPVEAEVAQEVKEGTKSVSLGVVTEVPGKKARKAPARKPKSRPKKETQVIGEPVALIMAKPVTGYSPLKVQFYGGRSYSPHGRIIAYSWDFGDGDTSTKKNPANTYLSMTYEPREFTVTLTVTDNKGNSASANQVIEVLNK
ncbi:MAG: PKD domain-containing protein [Candidatus Omnitrophica bacterium]|nr:PKD domain-containing protein [Candidatus Omnitrophota bacterium]